MVGQMELIDYLRELHPEEPQFGIGQEIYIRELDTVCRAVVILSYPLRDRGYGYHIRYDDGRHNTVWDEKIGKTVFRDEESALTAISKLSYDRFDPAQAGLSDCITYEYTREFDNYTLKAVLAKVGDLMIYAKDFYCYHFLRNYPTKKKRDAEYEKMLAKIVAEADENHGRAGDAPEFEVLYKGGSIYASRGYALNHLEEGRWGKNGT